MTTDRIAAFLAVAAEHDAMLSRMLYRGPLTTAETARLHALTCELERLGAEAEAEHVATA